MQLVNLLLLFHIGLSSSNSTIKITDVMITAARIAFGIYAREGIRKPKANRTKMPIEKNDYQTFLSPNWSEWTVFYLRKRWQVAF